MRKDYTYHTIAGLLIALAVLIPVTIWGKGDPYNYGVGAAALAVFVIGGTKELIWDKWLGKGTPEGYDLFCTIE